MNSNRPQPEEPAFTSWLETAKHRFPGATFYGSGRYAVAPMDRTIWMYETFEAMAAKLTTCPEGRYYDLDEQQPKVEPRKPRYGRLHRIAGEGQDE